MSEPGFPPQSHIPNPMSQPEEQCISPYPMAAVNEEPVVPNPAPPPAEPQAEHQQPPIEPVINQPGAINPVPHQVQPYEAPIAPPMLVPVGVPPGLEYLTQIDQILIHQKMECIEMFTGFVTNNQYEIKNSLGQLIFQAKEKTDCCTRNICGSSRHFQIRIKDYMKQEVMRVRRPYRCDSCCCPCCLQLLEVQAPPGIPIGYVKQNCHPFLPVFSIQGADRKVVMKIRGPYLPCKCCGDVNFQVKGKNGGKPFGRVTKQRGGCIRKCFTDATNYTVQFPKNMDVKMKAVLIGACFLIDFMYFEKGGKPLLSYL